MSIIAAAAASLFRFLQGAPMTETPATADAVPDPSSPIMPTVGRVVLYTPYHVDAARSAKGQPYPADITHVFGKNCVNLCVKDDGSWPLAADDLKPTSVTYDANGGARTWRWMDFQMGQAQKTDELTPKVAMETCLKLQQAQDEIRQSIAEMQEDPPEGQPTVGDRLAKLEEFAGNVSGTLKDTAREVQEAAKIINERAANAGVPGEVLARIGALESHLETTTAFKRS